MLFLYNAPMYRLLIASPYPVIRVGLRALLEPTSSTAVLVGEAATLAECLDAARLNQPDVIVFDLALDADEELTGLWRLRAQEPLAAILALVDSNADPRLLAALQAGAQGGLPKTITGPELAEATRRAAMGEPILNAAATNALLEQLRGGPAPESLTPRETEILRHVAAGQTNKAIAQKIGISEHTVKFHLGGAMSKLGAASRAEAVATAMRRGLIAV